MPVKRGMHRDDDLRNDETTSSAWLESLSPIFNVLYITKYFLMSRGFVFIARLSM